MKSSIVPLILALSLLLWPIVAVVTADPPKPPAAPATVATDDAPALRKQLAEAKSAIASLQRRLTVATEQRNKLADEVVLMGDELLLLRAELASRSK